MIEQTDMFMRPTHGQRFVVGTGECIACRRKYEHIEAPVRTAWVRCEGCGKPTVMFVFRGR